MLRTLLTPLRSRFDISPLSPRSAPLPPDNDDELAPEDFARDVLIQLMRNSVDNLKSAENATARDEVLTEIQRIMLQESRTKDVFRELDGFLVLMSVLSAIQASDEMQQVLEGTRLVFMILSEAMHEHYQNEEYFAVSVGYESLAHALYALVSDPRTVDESMGFLLSLALHDFALSGLFTTLRHLSEDDIELKLTEFQPRLGLIHRPGAIAVLWSFIPHLYATDASMRYALFKLFELLSHKSHRNHALLSTLGLVSPLLEYWSQVKNGSGSEKERYVLQKLLKRLLEMGATTADARLIFQQAVREDDTLDPDVLDIVRTGIKSRWTEHISMESRARLVISQEHVKGLPSTGFTLTMWLWIENYPKETHTLFTIRVPSRNLIVVSLRQDGHLQLLSSANRDIVVLEHSMIPKARWTHFALVHYPQRDRASSNRTIRIFLDGALTESLNWTYPRPESSHQTIEYLLGDDASETKFSWCLASAHLLSIPLVDDILRLIHHLGARYSGNFQDPGLINFLTYEATTSINIFLFNVGGTTSTNGTTTTKNGKTITKPPVDSLPLMKAAREGLSIPQSTILFSLVPVYVPKSGRPAGQVLLGTTPGMAAGGSDGVWNVHGDVVVIKAATIDMALWKIGGAAVGLRLVQLANTPHELSRAIGVLIDGLKNSWQNSDDMERLRGYEVLADILRTKAHLINMTTFETLFEFLGVSFRSPEQSTIVNVYAYKALALDFELWSRTLPDIQRVHLEQFLTALRTSRFKKYNSRQPFAKMGLVRRFLFVLQTNWYHHDMLRHLVDTLKIITQANFSRDDAIKPLVTYLAANLHDEGSVAASPASYVSRIDYKDVHEKAEMVLDLLTSTLSIPVLYTKFTTTLPLARICLLLLGDKPSSYVASQILTIIAISMNVTVSFSRKFELISGWSVLKTVLPSCWDPTVHEAALDVLLGRVHRQSSQANGNGSAKPASTTNEIVCPAIVPTILAALQTGLVAAGNNCQASDESYSTAAEATMEVLVEELIDLHTSSAAFRQIFESQQTTKLFVDAYKRFVKKVASVEVNQRTMRLIEKLNHLGLALALDNAVAGSQKREILDTLRVAEAVLNPSAEKTIIDPGLVADTRSIRQRIASVRLSIQVGERTVIKTITRSVDWQKSIQVSERKRLRKSILDLREDRRQISRLYDWTIFLTSERGLWQRHETQLWRLDETEGPHRIRKKLEPQCEKPASRVETAQEPIRAIQAPETETSSLLQVEIPPWNESYEISSTEIEDRQLAEDIVEDKHLRVRHELELGDVIDAIATVARVAGVDSSPGLLILGRSHLYMLDGLVQSDDGEVIEAKEAPRRLFFVPGSIVELDGPQKAQRWAHHQIASFSTKTFLFRDVGLELYFKDSRSLLIVFLEKEKRADVEQKLTAIIGRTDALLTPGPQRTPRLGKLGVKLGFREDELAVAQHKWQAREISNFTYLCILNQVSGRTPSDATQYPVFPWVLRDYTSQTLELSSPDVYRDLSKPMGAMTDIRREAAQTRYQSLQSVEEKPFHYGTHFSSSMIVCHFLIRMAPFTNMFKTLQGGDWDLPDRLFVDIARAYESAAHDVRGDVRELIPEFFTCPEFLENSANLDFGVQQNNGERIHDVKLPPWARQDPLLFVIMNRRALESQYVSDHLPEWIDLIWGCKQGDPEALNVFHPLSYEGAIDLDSITDDLEREATVGIIHNFGQTPRKLFTTPHPNRFTHGPLTLPIGTLHGIEEDPHLLNQGSKCFKDLGPTIAVRDLAFDMIGEKIIPCPEGVLVVPLHPHEEVEWGFNRIGGDELRLLVDHKVVQVVEGAFCTCASFADPDNLVTGSSDHTVRLWKLVRNHPHYGPLHVGLSHILRGHTERVTCVTACRPWSIVVSGSEDGSAVLWCLNRGTYIRSIWHRDSGDTSASHESTVVSLVAVNESTGYIATCSASKLMLHSINARPMAVLDLTSLSPICSLAFHEREYSPLGILAAGSADGTITLRTWTADGTPEGEKAKWEFLDIRKMKTRAAHLARSGAGRPPAVTALKFLGESLCHGEETGKAYLWTLPD